MHGYGLGGCGRLSVFRTADKATASAGLFSIRHLAAESPRSCAHLFSPGTRGRALQTGAWARCGLEKRFSVVLLMFPTVGKGESEEQDAEAVRVSRLVSIPLKALQVKTKGDGRKWISLGCLGIGPSRSSNTTLPLKPPLCLSVNKISVRICPDP